APDVPSPASRGDATGEGGGRHAAAPSPDARGPTVRTERAEGTGSVDPAATVRAAARNGRSRPADADLRRAVRADDADTLTVFVADASASMAPAMRAAKGVALELLRDAYAERDEVALVAFGGDGAEVLLPPTTSVSLAARQLKELPAADRTPLPDGLREAAAVVEREEPAAATVVLVSDGRANVAGGSPTAATREAAERVAETDASVLVVDAGEPRAGVLDVVCEATEARRTPLGALSPESVVGDY
ncbi:magnesium chelatase, partial [Halorubrum ezzemoulense]